MTGSCGVKGAVAGNARAWSSKRWGRSLGCVCKAQCWESLSAAQRPLLRSSVFISQVSHECHSLDDVT